MIRCFPQQAFRGRLLFRPDDRYDRGCDGMDLSFTDFYQKYYNNVVGYLSHRVANRQDAEDIASQVFMYCYQNWDKYDDTKSSLQSWLYLIVKSRWKNYMRDKKPYEDIDDFREVLHDGKDFAEQAAELDSIRVRMAKALSALSEQQRNVVVLRYFKEMTDAEIALALQLSVVNVRVIAHRALHKMEGSLSGITDIG